MRAPATAPDLWLEGDAAYATDDQRQLEQVSGSLGFRLVDPVALAGALLGSGLSLWLFGTHDPGYRSASLRIALDLRWLPAFDLRLACEPGLLHDQSQRQARLWHRAELNLAWVVSQRWRLIWASIAEAGDDFNAVHLTALLESRL